jgi:hypothetical protein
MAFRNVATVIAEGISLDGLSVFNMMEAVFAPAFPAVVGKLAVVNIYEIEGERGPRWERVQVRDSGGVVLAESLAELAGEGLTHRSMVLFQGIRIAQPGEYLVTVEGARRRDGPWEPVGTRRLLAILGPHPLARTDQGAEARLSADTASLTE